MTLIMTVVFTALVAQSGVRSTMAEVKNAINTNVGAGFTATGSAGETADHVESGSAGTSAPREGDEVASGSGEAPGAGEGPAAQAGGTSRDSAGIDRQVAERLASLPQVARHSLEAAVLARPEGAQPVLGASGVQLDPQFAGDVSVTGTSDSSLNPTFQGKLYKLVEGEHVGIDGGSQAIIHREFADHNKLGVGDKLTLTRDGEKVTVTIAGILLPLGKSKGNVLSQFAIEAGIFAGVAAVIAALAGTVLSSRLGQAVFAQVGGEALSSIQPSTGVGDFVLALLLGAVIVLIGVSVGVLPLVMQRPKRILAKLS